MLLHHLTSDGMPSLVSAARGEELHNAGMNNAGMNNERESRAG